MDGVGASLRAARRAAGISLSEMARITNYSKAQLGHLETGTRTVTREHVSAYSRALGVRLDDLLPEEDRLNGYRTDQAALDAVSDVLASVRRLEDETSSAAVLPTVLSQKTLADRMAAQALPKLQPAALGLASEITQYIGWLHIPSHQWNIARAYLERAARIARDGDDALRLATALSFRAYVDLRTDKLRDAQDFSESAAQDTRIDPGLRTYLTYQRAEVMARNGDSHGASELLIDADRLVDRLPNPEELPPSGYWYVPSFFLGQRAFVLRALGDVKEARRSAAACLEAMPPEWATSEWAQRRRALAEE